MTRKFGVAGRRAAVVCAIAGVLFGSQTKTWTQGEFADYEKGVLKNLSVRSDGLLTLAPKSRELFDTATAYLWALAQDSKGNLYVLEWVPYGRVRKFTHTPA